MGEGSTKRWVGRLLVGLMIAVGACSQNRMQMEDPWGAYDPADPFDDAFFDSSFESDALDEVYGGPAPSVGWLYDGEGATAQALDDHADPFWDDVRDHDGFGPQREQTFSEKAQEASLATLSILVGAGMTALPFLIGT